MIQLTYDDESIREGVEGRFLLALAQAIAELNISPLKELRVDPYPLLDNFKLRPAIMVCPTIESFLPSEQMGKYEVNYTAIVTLISDSVELNKQALGWHLKVRDRLLKGFSGQQRESTHLVIGQDCFELSVTPGVRFIPAGRARNLLIGGMSITGRWTGV